MIRKDGEDRILLEGVCESEMSLNVGVVLAPAYTPAVNNSF